jgi:small subunit ribosomal protein S3
MARREQIKKGRLPLQTFRADIDFAREKAILPYGTLGVKVWIYRGDIFEDRSKGREAEKRAESRRPSNRNDA